MEDHLRNRDRLAKEWQALCAYQAEPNTCDAAQHEANIKKNRNPGYVPCECMAATVHMKHRPGFLPSTLVDKSSMRQVEAVYFFSIMHGLKGWTCGINAFLVWILMGKGLCFPRIHTPIGQRPRRYLLPPISFYLLQ